METIARFTSWCHLCHGPIAVGEQVGVFLGRWVHCSCKKTELSRRTKAAGPPVELELVMPVDNPVDNIGSRVVSRRSLRRLRARKGR